ncbi:TPA: ATP-binding protein [Pseudomonas aeruginosa]|uniref:sensor histidine kinase n=1 Tax=Pseudomonas aeruginosa TaxID=287 RepID=UPI00232CD138|nr:ATP-binding protein [Pseudomonas aeruginosa]
MVKAKIYAGIAIIVVFGVMSMLYVYRGLDEVVGHLTRLERIGAPFSIAALEMEKNVGEYAFGVQQYIVRPDPEIRAETANDSTDFSRYHASYMQLSRTRRENELGHHLASDFGKLSRIGATLMDKRDRLDVGFAHVTGLLEQVVTITGQSLPLAAAQREPARSRSLAALANLKARAAQAELRLSAFRRRPTALAMRQAQEEIAELEEALSGYRRLSLGSEARRLEDELVALRIPLRSGVEAWLSGEGALQALAGEFARLQEHIDDVCDKEIEPLAAKGLTTPQEQADRIAVRVLDMLRYAIPLYLLVALGVGASLVLAIVRPLRTLASGTRAIGAGDLDYRILERNRDEFDDLARQFNRMVARLQESTVSRGLLEDSERRLRLTVAELREEIAERERSEREREKLQAELRRSEAMAAMGRLVAGVAHEVRNPLFGISSTLDALEASANVGKGGERHREVLRGEVGRLNKLMTGLLEYGRPPGETFSSGRLGQVIVEAVRICGPAAEAAGVGIVYQVDGCDGTLPMNHGRLLQVFVNLIENAVQHAPAGSQVTVAAKTLEVNGQRSVECRVEDSGAGFAPEDLPFIFDPFFTRRRKGTGLGLAIVQRIVEEHKGSIEAGGAAQGGAVMRLRLPIPD